VSSHVSSELIPSSSSNGAVVIMQSAKRRYDNDTIGLHVTWPTSLGRGRSPQLSGLIDSCKAKAYPITMNMGLPALWAMLGLAPHKSSST